MNDLVTAAEEAERTSSIRTELQRLGIAKVDLAYKAVKDDLKKVFGWRNSGVSGAVRGRESRIACRRE